MSQHESSQVNKNQHEPNATQTQAHTSSTQVNKNQHETNPN